ncbi:hypothetical protein ACGFZR_04380, partial [Streptomyces sp. NPDC048241]|uniref:hypothetical protein n=1 Tax=Streptomyces sp. NPDC048241 TaxID=3365521 RepID=UPI00371C8556
ARPRSAGTTRRPYGPEAAEPLRGSQVPCSARNLMRRHSVTSKKFAPRIPKSSGYRGGRRSWYEKLTLRQLLTEKSFSGLGMQFTQCAMDFLEMLLFPQAGKAECIPFTLHE